MFSARPRFSFLSSIGDCSRPAFQDGRRRNRRYHCSNHGRWHGPRGLLRSSGLVRPQPRQGLNSFRACLRFFLPSRGTGVYGFATKQCHVVGEAKAGNFFGEVWPRLCGPWRSHSSCMVLRFRGRGEGEAERKMSDGEEDDACGLFCSAVFSVVCKKVACQITNGTCRSVCGICSSKGVEFSTGAWIDGACPYELITLKEKFYHIVIESQGKCNTL